MILCSVQNIPKVMLCTECLDHSDAERYTHQDKQVNTIVVDALVSCFGKAPADLILNR